MKKEHMIHIRVNKEEKDAASEILEELGTNLSAVINILIKNVILYKGIPFEVVLPNISTHPEEQESDSTGKYTSEPEEVSSVVPENVNGVSESATIESYDEPLELETDVFDTSDLDRISDMFGIPLGQNKEKGYESTDDTVNKNDFILGMLDD